MKWLEYHNKQFGGILVKNWFIELKKELYQIRILQTSKENV